MKWKKDYVKTEFEYKKNKHLILFSTFIIFMIMTLNNDLIEIANTFLEHLYLFTGMYILSLLLGLLIDYVSQYCIRHKKYIEVKS